MGECKCGHPESEHTICLTPRHRAGCEAEGCECVLFREIDNGE